MTLLCLYLYAAGWVVMAALFVVWDHHKKHNISNFHIVFLSFFWPVLTPAALVVLIILFLQERRKA